MIINITYQGALATRAAQNKSDINPLALAGQKIKGTLHGKAYQLTISDELIQMQNQFEDFLAKDIHVQKADPNDIFSYRPSDQWLVFSQYLNDAGAFDELSSDEVKEMESMLQQMTDGLDSLTELGINFFAGVTKPLTSYEAQLEFVSSTKALQVFSEKYLVGETKVGFDTLIDQYWLHNEKKVSGYQSIEERFYEARSKLNLGHVSLSAKQAHILNITNQLGKFKASEESLKQLMEDYSNLFEKLQKEQVLSYTVNLLREKMLQFVTQGVSSKDAVKQWVNERVENTFERIEGYWGMLLDNE